MMSEVIVSEKTDSDKISFLLWISFGICFFCNISAGLISTLMAVYLPVVVKSVSGEVKGDELNNISAYINSLYIAGWAIGGFFWGLFSDKIGRVRALALSTGCFGLFTILISFATSWESVLTFRLLSGLSVGGILVITPTLLSEIWPQKSSAVMIGIDSIGFPIGIFSSGLVNLLVNDWRGAFLIGAAPLAIAIISLKGLQESQDWQRSRSEFGSNLSQANAINKANLMKGAIIFGSMLIGLWGMFSWIPTWVQSLLVNSDGQTERGISMMLLGAGGLIGGFISGWVSNFLGVRKSMMLCFSGCMVMSFLLFGMNGTFSKIIYIELAVLSLFFGISQGLLSIYIPQLFPVHIRGTCTGICFNVGRIVTAFAIFFVGLMVTGMGGYSNALLIFASVFALGFITISFTRAQSN